MRNLRSQEEIMATWQGDTSNPLVTICCITYNHEHYIEDALEGFLIQETNFPFEILVHDDASNDKTSQILRVYQAKFPRLIKLQLQTENQRSQGKRILPYLTSLSESKYLSVCEGDDFWRDATKLQKQFDYLEEHPECFISSHDFITVDELGKHKNNPRKRRICKADATNEQLKYGKVHFPTMSWVFRNINLNTIPELMLVTNVDSFCLSIFGNYGYCHFHKEITPSAYREHTGGVWSLTSELQKISMQANTWYWMFRYYLRIRDYKCSLYFALRSLKYHAQYFVMKTQS